MITKTSREIIDNACLFAGCDNTPFFDFKTKTSLLNRVYRELYDDIVRNSHDFEKEVTIENEDILPADCYSITQLSRNGVLINKSNYVIQNGVYYGPKATLVYSTLPVTLTAPDENVAIVDEEVIQSIPTDGAAYYVIEEDGDYTFVRNTSGQYLFHDFVYDIPNQTFVWNGEDVRDYLDPDSKGIINIQYDSPYMVVTYTDHTIFVFTGFSGAEWNYECIHGHPTFGEVVALKTDDITGKGMIYKDMEGNYFYASFVPDTVLSYPTNALFSLMELKIAQIMVSLTGQQNPLLDEKLEPEAEVEFYQNLDYGNQVSQMKVYDTPVFRGR